MAKNLFDDAQSVTFKTTAKTFGYAATWVPSVGGDPLNPIKAQVLYNDPTAEEKIEDTEYDPYAYQMEYEKGDFDGLKDAADALKTEKVVIDTRFGLKTFFVRKVRGKYDGNTYLATLELKE